MKFLPQNMCIHIASKDLCPASEIDFSISNVIVGTPKDIVQYIENKSLCHAIAELYLDDADAYCNMLYMSRFVRNITAKIVYLTSVYVFSQAEWGGVKVFKNHNQQNVKEYLVWNTCHQLKLDVV